MTTVLLTLDTAPTRMLLGNRKGMVDILSILEASECYPGESHAPSTIPSPDRASYPASAAAASTAPDA